MYVRGNPILLIDPNGMSDISTEGRLGKHSENHLDTETNEITFNSPVGKGYDAKYDMFRFSTGKNFDGGSSGGDDDDKKKSTKATSATKPNNNNKTTSAAATYLLMLEVDLVTPDPTDAAWPKWAVHAVLGTASVAILYYAGEGNDNYPGPLSTDRPNNYIPRTPNGPGKSYFPKGNGNNLANWIIRAGGATVLGLKLHDGFTHKSNTLPADNTNVIRPMPLEPPPFITPL